MDDEYHFQVTPDSSSSSPSEPLPRIGRPIFAGYQVEGELGRGGMGVVFRARQKGLNRLVALKMLTGHYGPDELARFRAEAETAASLHHSNIVQIYEVGEDQSTPFFAMEHIESGSLADRLRRGPIPDREAVELLICVARALHFAHQNGVVHRDMKPANILLDPAGVPKVTDFGIAKRLSGDSALTLTGAVIGTPTYMAPEQAKGTSRDVSAAADIYSLGAILYEMLAGRPPFLPEESETAITVRVITEDPVSPAWHRPGIPRDLETICLKCLEKEPRHRYASAAAFAEDLRRFLDDESILARPPNTVSRMVKWTRRHPWRTSFALALLVCVGIGLERLRVWEFYERSRVEWAETLEMVNGEARPLMLSSASAASKRQLNFRLTRRGRFGPVTRVEALNARNHPALIREIFFYEIFPNWLEGAMGAQKAAPRTRETTQLDFVYSGNDLLETTALDRNGHVTWRLLWDRVATQENNRRIARARFVDLRGFDFSTMQGASHAEFLRDAAGRDEEVHFFNGAGRPTANNENVFGLRAERNADGRVIQYTNLDQKGQPMANRLDMIALGVGYDAQGRVVRYDYRDGAGHATPWNGVSFSTMEYDAGGNLTAIRRWQGKDKLVNGASDGWALLEHKRNEHGESIEMTYQKVTSEGGLDPVSKTVLEYDAYGHPVDSKTTGAQNFRTQWTRDLLGNVLEKRLVDPDGHPVVGLEGWSIARYAYTPIASPLGWREETSLFDTKGEKTWAADGAHRTIVEFFANGDLRRMITEDQKSAEFGFYRVVSEPEFDAQQQLRKLIMRKEDKEGNVIIGPGVWGIIEKEFDEKGREIREWKVGSEAETSGAVVWHTETEWHGTGAQKRVVRQACDAQRKPLAYTLTGRGARIEEEYDALERSERIYETGFDEKLVGFNAREVRFSSGNFLGVTHKRSNGSSVESVRVMVKDVVPQQPKASELKAGDQLLAANGNPVRSAYEWAFTAFNGGWIEVLRDGHTIRIEGFEEGSIGLILEDRAPVAK